MRLDELVQFITLTIALTIGVAVSATTAFRANISANWTENRCSPGVVPIASFFKPSSDSRTPSQFARDNWSFCQKKYIQGALNAAAAAPKELVNASEASVGLIQNVAGVVADVFYDLWNFVYQAYSTFMEKMKGASKLFHNFMINLHSIVDRLQASVLAIVFGLMSLIAAFVSSVQVVLIVAIVIIGILVALQVLLFFVLLPIAPLIISMTALVSVVVIAVATAIAAALVAETFTPGVCFTGDTRVLMADGTQIKRIDAIQIGDLLDGDTRVTAVHRFKSNDDVYDLYGIRVTGDHLVRDPTRPDTWIAVHDHPAAIREDASVGTWFNGGTDLWCLTTTKRTIPCLTATGATLTFADWEEIPEEDEAGRVAWYGDVWRQLNGSVGPMRPATARALNSEAGFSPDCKVACSNWLGSRVWRRIMDVKIGDTVWTSDTETTTVVGHVILAGDQCTDAVIIPGGEGALTTCGTWFWQNSAWNPATAFQAHELHPTRWHHLYTTAGSFMIAGSHQVRDASDVGLGELKPLVEEIVLGRQQEVQQEKPTLC
jgi:hypothetical protein